MVKVSIVSYLNSSPFVYGLRNHIIRTGVELSTDTPSECAEKLLRGEVDLGLVPVAIIPELKRPHIVSEYCIGADGPVESVCLFSEVPLEQIHTILLDPQSRTSVQLVQYLAQKRWNIAPQWKPAGPDLAERIGGSTAGVVIGDRAFPLTEQFAHVTDLAEEWKLHTGLPFVFACWVSNRKLDPMFIKQFEDALRFGLDHRTEAVLASDTGQCPDPVRYVQHTISYHLDDKKKRAMKLFLDWMSSSPYLVQRTSGSAPDSII